MVQLLKLHKDGGKKKTLDYKEILRNLRIDHDYSQEDVANFLKIERKTYNRYESENHSSEIKFRDAIELARLYNVSLDYIAGLIDTPQTIDRKPYNPQSYIVDQVKDLTIITIRENKNEQTKKKQ